MCVCNISFFACLQQLCVRWVCVCVCVYVCVLLLCLPRTQRRRRCSCSCCYCCVFFLFFIGSCSGKEKGCVPAVKTVKTTNETKLLLQPHPFCELFRVKQQLINCTQGKRNYNKKCMQKKNVNNNACATTTNARNGTTTRRSLSAPYPADAAGSLSLSLACALLVVETKGK